MTQHAHQSVDNDAQEQHPHDDHHHDHSGVHGHTHGIVDPSLASNERGIWAIKWSFAGLLVTA